MRELSQTAGRLGDSRSDLFGTVKNLQVLVDALSNSNEQIVQFAGHVASVSQVLADSSADLDTPWAPSTRRSPTSGDSSTKTTQALIAQVASSPTSPRSSATRARTSSRSCTSRPRDPELLQHLRPRPGHRGRLLSLPNFTNPVQFICGGSFDVGAITGLLQAGRDLSSAWPRCSNAHDELPPDPVPPDQQHHRLQGPDHLRHPGDRSQGRDAGTVVAMASRTRSDTADTRPTAT